MKSGKREKLLIIGDSITLGAAELTGQEVTQHAKVNYVNRLGEFMPDLEILTDAAVHRTTSQACELIEAQLKHLAPTAVLLMIGGNDADIDWKRWILSQGRIVRHRVPAARYADNLLFLIKKIRAAWACPILTDFPEHHLPLRAVYFSRLAGRDISPWIEAGGGQAESDRRLEHIRLALSEVVRRMEVPFIAYAPALCRQDPLSMLSEDGVHPSAAGHEVIAGVLGRALKRMLERRVPSPEQELLPDGATLKK